MLWAGSHVLIIPVPPQRKGDVVSYDTRAGFGYWNRAIAQHVFQIPVDNIQRYWILQIPGGHMDGIDAGLLLGHNEGRISSAQIECQGHCNWNARCDLDTSGPLALDRFTAKRLP